MRWSHANADRHADRRADGDGQPHATGPWRQLDRARASRYRPAGIRRDALVRQDLYPNNEVYDPKTDTWQTVAAIRTPRHAAHASAQNDKIYVPAGATHSGYGATTVNEVYTVPSNRSCE
jgi:hypothetical protein